MKPIMLAAAVMATLAAMLGSASAEPVELQWWHAMTAINAERVNKIATDFNALQTGYKIVPVLGVLHRIRRESDPAAPPVAIVDGEIRVRGEPAHLARRVRDHLISLARQELGRRARLHAARIGKPVARVSVRDTKSRWGSCSAKGSLSFSWRLVLAPDNVVDYVVAHEVAHLAEMNHGPRFWRLLRSLTPDCAAPRAWLTRHRARLLSYG